MDFILVLNFCFHSSEDTAVLLRPALNIGKEDVETLGVKNIEVLVCKVSLISCKQLVQDSKVPLVEDLGFKTVEKHCVLTQFDTVREHIKDIDLFA